jgi:hypothetical protein
LSSSTSQSAVAAVEGDIAVVVEMELHAVK